MTAILEGKLALVPRKRQLHGRGADMNPFPILPSDEGAGASSHMVFQQGKAGWKPKAAVANNELEWDAMEQDI